MVYLNHMNPEEIVLSIEQQYQHIARQIDQLDQEKKGIINQYIKKLEQEKIEQIKQELNKLSTHS